MVQRARLWGPRSDGCQFSCSSADIVCGSSSSSSKQDPQMSFVSANIIVSPEWIEMRREVLDVVRRYPVLRAEMLEAQSSGGSGCDGE